MSDESPATLRRIAEEGARLAGKVLSERFPGERTIEYKGGIDTDLVTDADRAAEAAVLGFIRQRYPGHAIQLAAPGQRSRHRAFRARGSVRRPAPGPRAPPGEMAWR